MEKDEKKLLPFIGLEINDALGSAYILFRGFYAPSEKKIGMSNGLNSGGGIFFLEDQSFSFVRRFLNELLYFGMIYIGRKKDLISLFFVQIFVLEN